MSACTISFSAVDPSLATLPGAKLVFTPRQQVLRGAGDTIMVPSPVTATANGAGTGTVALAPGDYTVTMTSNAGSRQADITVPDAATAILGDLVGLPIGAWEFSQLQAVRDESRKWAINPVGEAVDVVAGLQRFSSLHHAERAKGFADRLDLGYLDSTTALMTTLAGQVQVNKEATDGNVSLALAAQIAAQNARDASFLSRGSFASVAEGLSNGVVGVTSVVAGSGGANGTFALAFSGGGGSGAAGVFTVAGGSIVAGSIVITNPGVSYTSAPTISFAASAGLTGASAVAQLGARNPVGTGFAVRGTGNDAAILYRVDAGPVAVEVGRITSAAVTGPFNLNQRIQQFPNRTTFVATEVQGGFATDGVTIAETNWSIDANGALDLTGTLTATSLYRSYWAGHVRNAGESVEIFTEIELNTGFTSSHGPAIGLGDPGAGSRVWIVYSDVGNMALTDGNGTTVGGQSIAMGTPMSFTSGQRAGLRVVVYGDGTGFAEAIAPTGQRGRLALSGLPTGRIMTAWRRSANRGRITGFSVRPYAIPTAIDPDAPILAKVRDAGDQFRAASTGAASSVYRYTFDTDGKMTITAGGSAMMHLRSRYRRTRDAALEIFVEAEVTNTTGSRAAGCVIGIGDPFGDETNRKSYVYLENGFVGLLSTANSTAEGAVLNKPWTTGQRGALRLLAYRDGTGLLESIAPDGTRYTMNVSGIPTGAIHVGWRSERAGVIHRFSAVPIADRNPLSGGVSSATLRASVALPTPPSLAGRTPSGWTCTGADRYDFGTLEGLWLVSDDGRLVETDSSPYNAAVHLTSPSLGRVLKTLNLPTPTAASIQGVAIDRTLFPGTFWCARGNAMNNITHFQAPTGALDGAAVAAVEITADAIGWATNLGQTGSVNGLAENSDDGTLFAGSIAGMTVVEINKTTKSVVRTLTLTAPSAPDQLQYLPRLVTPDGQPRLLYTVGSNGSNGVVWVYNLTTNLQAAWTSLPGAQAIEQFFYDPATNLGYAFSDGGYHPSATPATNLVAVYTMPPLPI